MTLYCDASALLRLLLKEPGQLPEIRTATRRVASELVRVECLRVLDRMRLECNLDDAETSSRLAAFDELLLDLDLVTINQAVLARAAEPLPVIVGTLDAIHLATALILREEFPGDLRMATHDRRLGTAAQSYGIKVLGVA